MPTPRPHRPELLRFLAVGLAALVTAAASGQLRVVNWNVARLQGDADAVRSVFTALAEDDWPGFAAAPHVVVLQEVPSNILGPLEAILNSAVPGVEYALATYTSSAAENQSGGAQALFYRPDLVVELPAGHLDIPTGAGRNTDRWHLRLAGYASAQARFYVYGSHLKASPGAANEAERLAGAQAIRANADQLPAGTHIIFCGDYNLYSNLEPAYAVFLAPGIGQAIDPLGTGTWNGPAHAIKHTQSPRDIAAGGLVGGGLDDRFDFQLSTGAFHDDAGLSLVPGSKRAVGNDGAHYDVAINAGNNFYFPGDLVRSNALADLLFAASDHLPVVCDYRLPAVMTAALTPDFGKVIRGSDFAVHVLVQNLAVGAPAAIDPLVYQVQGTGVLGGTFGGTAPIAPDFATVPVPVSTTTVGLVSGSAVVTALSQAAQSPLQLLPTGGRIVRPANASFSGSDDVDAIVVEIEASPRTGSVPIPVAIHNLGYDVDQATLDVDAVLDLGGGFALDGALPVGIGSEPGTIPLLFQTRGASPGVVRRSLAIVLSDEDVPGAATSVLSLDVVVTIVADGPDADLNGDGVVDAIDLSILLGQWGAPGIADLNDDGVVDAVDLTILLGSWG